MARGHGVVAQGRRLGAAEAGRVRGRLGAKLGQVKIGAGAVSQVHRLEETALGVVAVEDEAVESDGYDLDDDLDDDAHEGPVLKATDELIVDLLGEDVGPCVVDAGPSPHVLVVAVVLGMLEHDGGDNPEDQARDELMWPVSKSWSSRDAPSLTQPTANI